MAFCFEDQVLDQARRELSRAGTAVPLEPRVFDLVVYLIENRDRVVSKDDLMARVWGGRIVSDSALTGAINAARQALGDSGRDQRLIRTISRKGFRFVGTIANGATIGPTASPTLPDKQSIAVLPFANMSDDHAQEYFADGIVDDIITALSRFKSLFVIARNSSFTYKGRAVDIRQVGRELGVRYVLEGSVRNSSGRIRVTGQLLDSQTGAHVWAERFDGKLEDVFDLQDRIAAEVANQLVHTIERAEIERVRRRPATSTSAYESHLLGMRSLYRSTAEAVEEALRHYYRAIELDPEFAAPHTWAAIAYSRRKQGRWMADVRGECEEGVRLGRRAVELRDDDAQTIGVAGFIMAWLGGEVEAGLTFIERALALNPNDALVWQGSAWVRCYNGQHDLAVEHIERAARLSPVDPQTTQFQLVAAMAHYCAGRFDEAASCAEQALRRQPDLVPALISLARSCAMVGRLEDARRAMGRALQLNPSIRYAHYEAGSVMRRREDSDLLEKGMFLAGIPE